LHGDGTVLGLALGLGLILDRVAVRGRCRGSSHAILFNSHRAVLVLLF